jgi:hypothetical protein
VSLTIGSSYCRQELKILVLCSCHLHNLGNNLGSDLDVLAGILDVLRGPSQFSPLLNVEGGDKGGKLLGDKLRDLQHVSSALIRTVTQLTSRHFMAREVQYLHFLEPGFINLCLGTSPSAYARRTR